MTPQRRRKIDKAISREIRKLKRKSIISKRKSERKQKKREAKKRDKAVHEYAVQERVYEDVSKTAKAKIEQGLPLSSFEGFIYYGPEPALPPELQPRYERFKKSKQQ